MERRTGLFSQFTWPLTGTFLMFFGSACFALSRLCSLLPSMSRCLWQFSTPCFLRYLSVSASRSARSQVGGWSTSSLLSIFTPKWSHCIYCHFFLSWLLLLSCSFLRSWRFASTGACFTSRYSHFNISYHEIFVIVFLLQVNQFNTSACFLPFAVYSETAFFSENCLSSSGCTHALSGLCALPSVLYTTLSYLAWNYQYRTSNILVRFVCLRSLCKLALL